MSKVIKASFTKNDSNDKKLIQIRNYFPAYKENQDEHAYLVGDARLQAEAIITQARQETEALKREAERHYEAVQQQILQEKENWQAEKQRWIELAQKEGYEIGLKHGEERGFAKYKQLINEAQQIVASAQREFYNQIEKANETIFLIGLKVAERILGECLQENQDYFLSLVKRAVREVREHSEVKIYVHPVYYEVLVRQKEELKVLFSQEAHLFIYPDDQLPENGCVIESPFGRIDASIDTQLEQIKEKLLERIEEE